MMNQFKRFLSLCLISLLAPVAVQAAPITYDVTLTPTLGTTSGTGSFTIDGNDFTGIGNEAFEPGNVAKTLLDLQFNIGGSVFTLAQSSGYGMAFFQNGTLASIIYNGVSANFLVSLNAGAMTYIFNDYTNMGLFTLGQLSATRRPDSGSGPSEQEDVPEPGLLVLFGISAIGLGLSARRRTRTAA